MSECGGKPVGYNQSQADLHVGSQRLVGRLARSNRCPVVVVRGGDHVTPTPALAGGKCDNSGQRLGSCMGELHQQQ